MRRLRFILLLTVALCAACTRGSAQENAERSATIDYQRDIRPILSDTCFKCHGPDEAARQGDLRLDLAAEAQPVLVPDGEDEPLIIQRVTSRDAEDRMPPPHSGLTLTPKQVESIKAWVSQGAPYTVHWSFRAITAPPLPEVDLPRWNDNPIDRLVYAAMQAHGLTPSPPASKEEWLRRLAFDLTGLPPSTAELDAFLRDDSVGAWEKMVDHYLAQPAYGERMAFHWMEVARYADSYGYQVDRDRVVWQWRDWVIDAFNRNQPYDEFVIEQLAGDLLPDCSDPQILATTFNRLHGQKAEGGSTPEEFRVEYVADRVQTFATAFMGMTLDCARCHNHKFDPVTQREYYQLFAFFNNIDEFGLHSYFTEAVPTPTLLLASDEQKQRAAELRAAVAAAEAEWREARESRRSQVAQWQSEFRPAGLDLNQLIPGRIGQLDFEGESPALGANQRVEGRFGSAVQFTGDDALELTVGNFRRHEPFSVSLWIKTPDAKSRAVVFHRSRAWTDAGSRGYELLLEDGRLSFALIHFWPGNALRIWARQPLPLQSWTHVVASSDGSSRAGGLTLFVNGQQADCEIVRDCLTKDITGGGGDNLALGARFRDSGFKDGAVDEVQVFDRALTALEIRHLYDGAALRTAFQAESPLGDAARSEIIEYYLATADEVVREKWARLTEARKALHDHLDPIPEIMVMREMEPRRTTYVLRRGAYDAPTDTVEPGTPQALPPMAENQPRNRLGLARWLTDRSHPLTARVAVNRFWQLIFGHGLVRTPEDFGSQGAPPTHPELLDWLAQEFITSGWDVKGLLKTMVLSETYRQSSWPRKDLAALDPDNVWLARMNRDRLDAEMLRDQILFASGLLDRTQGGPSVKPYEMAQAFQPQNPDEGSGLYRRSLYTYWKRNSPPPVMVALDAVRREICTVKKERTSTPLQAIVLLNDPQRLEAARMLAQQTLRETPDDLPAAIRSMFRVLTSRWPRPAEQQILEDYCRQQTARYEAAPEQAAALLRVGKTPLAEGVPPPQLAGLTLVAHVIMNTDACLTKR